MAMVAMLEYLQDKISPPNIVKKKTWNDVEKPWLFQLILVSQELQILYHISHISFPNVKLLNIMFSGFIKFLCGASRPVVTALGSKIVMKTT